LEPFAVDLVARSPQPGGAVCSNDLRAAVIDTIRRRPATLGDLVSSTGAAEGALRELLNSLVAAGEVRTAHVDDRTFYRAVS
jgi:DNA-binding IclR family transcriptional regulator